MPILPGYSPIDNSHNPGVCFEGPGSIFRDTESKEHPEPGQGILYVHLWVDGLEAQHVSYGNIAKPDPFAPEISFGVGAIFRASIQSPLCSIWYQSRKLGRPDHGAQSMTGSTPHGQ